jgi:glucose/arabinose dehydrogenase
MAARVVQGSEQDMKLDRWRAGASIALAACLAGGVAAIVPGVAGSQAPPQGQAQGGGGGGGGRAALAQLYTDNCSSCHGTDLAGGRGPSLFAQSFLEARSDDALHATILNGVPGGEMPPFKDVLSGEQVWQLVAYLRTQGEMLRNKPAFVADPNGQVIKSQKQTFRIETVAAGLDTPWGLAFLPDGRLLVTERSGGLRIIAKDGKLGPAVSGTPKPWVRQDAGMLDVAIHPNYRQNGWIYLGYTEVAPGVTPTPEQLTPPPGQRPTSPPSMTVVVRGRINARNEWVDAQTIFRAPAALYTPNGSHYGTRFTFDKEGHFFFSIGERGEMKNAQDLSNPLGKIHRVNDDGSIPKDNPFVGRPGAVASIWTYGHRNPQGLAWDPVTGLLWASEHGPNGGDEINIIEKGKNYGWGVITMGMQPGITKRTEPGMEQPIAYYTPTIAPSGIQFYTGDRYPGWRNNLFVAALAGQQLRRLEVRGREVVAQEPVFQQFGRTRAVAMGPDGLMYVLIQNPTGSGTGLSLSAATPGMVIRLVPVS